MVFKRWFYKVIKAQHVFYHGRFFIFYFNTLLKKFAAHLFYFRFEQYAKETYVTAEANNETKKKKVQRLKNTFFVFKKPQYFSKL